ncbi:MAG: FAD:protein FMN transferase, partial [Oceanobacter sp.]
QQVQLILSPGDKGVATSGDYRNYYEVKGERYSHTINPFTGKPIKHELASVTVVHNDCAYADAWATALNVAGPKAGMALAEKNQLAVYMIVRNNNGFDELASSQFVEQFGNPGSK